MPMYEFRCAACGDDFEELVRSDDERVECPSCGGADVCKKMSTFAHRSGGGGGGGASSASSGGGGHSCGGCGGGHCGSCGH